MRKHCKRIPRPLSRPLTPLEHNESMLRPRVHLQMLLTGHSDREYLRSLAGFFNTMGGLAFVHHRDDITKIVEAAQQVMFRLFRDARLPSSGEATILKKSLNVGDHFLSLQNSYTIFRAMEYVQRQLDEGEFITVDSERPLKAA